MWPPQPPGPPSPPGVGGSADNTQALRIGAGFLILFTGALGMVPPLTTIKALRLRGEVVQRLRAFGAHAFVCADCTT